MKGDSSLLPLELFELIFVVLNMTLKFEESF